MTEYADRDLETLEPHYSLHVSAMTREHLHAKSDIAAELAFRDVRIHNQRRTIEAMEFVMGKIGKHFGVDPGDVDGLFVAIESSTNATDEDKQESSDG